MTALDISHLVGDIVLVLGALVFFTCGIGVLTFRDIYTRLSVIGTAGGSGIILVIFGVWLKDPSVMGAIMGFGAIVLLIGTSALGTIMTARSALLRKTPMIQPQFDDTKLLPESTEKF